jgi:hypothetical protein
MELRMRTSPSIAPGTEADIYMVLSDYGQLGRSWPEMDEEHTDRETVIRHLLEGQYTSPVRVISFNVSEGWSRDSSEDIADELLNRISDEIPPSLQDFIEQHATNPRQRQLALL